MLNNGLLHAKCLVMLVLLIWQSHLLAQPSNIVPDVPAVQVTEEVPGMEVTEGVPAGLIMADQRLPYLFWVDLQKGKLHLLERTTKGSYINLKTVEASIGKHGFGKLIEGDKKTPVGVYHLTSFLDDSQVDEFYGSGAYPINYPNAWDRLSNRSGHGIWLHGLPKGSAKRPALDSDGCVVIDNPTLENLAGNIRTGESLIILAESLEWLAPDTVQPSSDVVAAINLWQKSWNEKDNETYLSLYHDEFTDSRQNLTEWKRYKTRVNNSKQFIDVKLSDMTIVDYPGEKNLLVARFYQSYSSNNFKWAGWKQLYWKRNSEGQWQIVYEGKG